MLKYTQLFFTLIVCSLCLAGATRTKDGSPETPTVEMKFIGPKQVLRTMVSGFKKFGSKVKPLISTGLHPLVKHEGSGISDTLQSYEDFVAKYGAMAEVQLFLRQYQTHKQELETLATAYNVLAPKARSVIAREQAVATNLARHIEGMREQFMRGDRAGVVTHLDQAAEEVSAVVEAVSQLSAAHSGIRGSAEAISQALDTEFRAIVQREERLKGAAWREKVGSGMAIVATELIAALIEGGGMSVAVGQRLLGYAFTARLMRKGETDLAAAVALSTLNDQLLSTFKGSTEAVVDRLQKIQTNYEEVLLMLRTVRSSLADVSDDVLNGAWEPEEHAEAFHSAVAAAQYLANSCAQFLEQQTPPQQPKGEEEAAPATPTSGGGGRDEL